MSKGGSPGCTSVAVGKSCPTFAQQPLPSCFPATRFTATGMILSPVRMYCLPLRWHWSQRLLAEERESEAGEQATNSWVYVSSDRKFRRTWFFSVPRREGHLFTRSCLSHDPLKIQWRIHCYVWTEAPSDSLGGREIRVKIFPEATTTFPLP